MSELTFPTPPHQWDPARAQWNAGRNDGFVRAHGGDTVMGYYDREVLPLYYALADRYTVCDRWFSSVLGPTWPNRFYLHATTARGIRDNSPMSLGGPATIWDRLAERCLRGVSYAAGITPWHTAAFAGRAFGGDDALVSAPIDAFFRDALKGTLPHLSIVDPDFQVNDDRPPHSAALGQAFVGSIAQALMASPQWSRSLLIIIYDEHGGFYDHVPPPQVADPEPDFAQLGFRVPALVVGPTVRAGHVCSTQLEHVSVAATLGARFGLRSLGIRMDGAADLSACINPALLGRPAAPPRDLPRVALRERAVLDALADHPDPARVRAWLRTAAELDAVALG